MDKSAASAGGSRPQFYTPNELAEILKVSRMTIYRMIHAGELPAIRVGGSYRVPESAFEALCTIEQPEEARELRKA